jgi:hypothetical protein
MTSSMNSDELTVPHVVQAEKDGIMCEYSIQTTNITSSLMIKTVSETMDTSFTLT